jgi:hypothetical protein
LFSALTGGSRRKESKSSSGSSGKTEEEGEEEMSHLRVQLRSFLPSCTLTSDLLLKL